MAQDAVAAQAKRNRDHEKVLPLDDGRMVRLAAIPRRELTRFAK
jgi:hypothetical protein